MVFWQEHLFFMEQLLVGYWYKKGEYIASVKATYSTRLANILDKETSDGIISYTKDGNNNIILKSFILKK